MSDAAEADDKETILVSLRLNPEVARAFKVEAARRGMRLNAFFAEVWRSYEGNRPWLPLTAFSVPA